VETAFGEATGAGFQPGVESGAGLAVGDEAFPPAERVHEGFWTCPGAAIHIVGGAHAGETAGHVRPFGGGDGPCVEYALHPETRAHLGDGQPAGLVVEDQPGVVAEIVDPIGATVEPQRADLHLEVELDGEDGAGGRVPFRVEPGAQQAGGLVVAQAVTPLFGEQGALHFGQRGDLTIGRQRGARLLREHRDVPGAHDFVCDLKRGDALDHRSAEETLQDRVEQPASGGARQVEAEGLLVAQCEGGAVEVAGRASEVGLEGGDGQSAAIVGDAGDPVPHAKSGARTAPEGRGAVVEVLAQEALPGGSRGACGLPHPRRLAVSTLGDAPLGDPIPQRLPAAPHREQLIEHGSGEGELA
jgi:hypothetical protein